MGSPSSNKLPKPKTVRMPVSTDGAVRDARAGATRDILGRRGAQSTILSEALKSLTGSIGRLGA